jgi:hypothetical protein
MTTEFGKPPIVIRYADAEEPEHPAADEVKWLSFVAGYLRPAIKHGAVDLWLDRLMPGGADWEKEIEQKLSICDIFILLVSRHSLRGRLSPRAYCVAARCRFRIASSSAPNSRSPRQRT